VLAQFCAEASYPAIRSENVQSVFVPLVSSLDFPIVITDETGLPRAWRGIDVDPDSVSADALDSLSARRPVPERIRERVEQVRRTARRLDHDNRPIPLIQQNANPVFTAAGKPPRFVADTLGAVHYGEPEVLDVLRWTPYVSLVGTLLLLGIGLWGTAVLRESEERTIWVGMAKETAHQLGTPLSSLMGWGELLRARVPDPPHGDVRLPATELAETVDEIGRDVARLRKVADRFSNVGSEPRLAPGDPADVVQDAVNYMRRRVGGDIELRERYVPTPNVRLNAELLEWALENLIANALSAIDKRPGRIDVAIQPSGDGKAVEITVTDNGRGMTSREQGRAFTPGYSTKRRGWGLGLPLTRRVVQEYHGGRVWIRQSVPGEGTVMAIRLPAAP
jgi:two-component system, NtrC family, sensor histidine kinase KinB